MERLTFFGLPVVVDPTMQPHELHFGPPLLEPPVACEIVTADGTRIPVEADPLAVRLLMRQEPE